MHIMPIFWNGMLDICLDDGGEPVWPMEVLLKLRCREKHDGFGHLTSVLLNSPRVSPSRPFPPHPQMRSMQSTLARPGPARPVTVLIVLLALDAGGAMAQDRWDRIDCYGSDCVNDRCNSGSCYRLLLLHGLLHLRDAA